LLKFLSPTVTVTTDGNVNNSDTWSHKRRGGLETSDFDETESHIHKRIKLKQELLSKHRKNAPVLSASTSEAIFEAQSGMESAMPSETMGVQNIGFTDENESYSVVLETTTDSLRTSRSLKDAEFKDFFSRPIKLFDYDWSTSTTLTGNFEPWTAFLSNKRVVNRLNNFYLMRGKMHLKFVVNGNGFHYGRAMACYLPYANVDQASSVSSLVTGPNVQLSQCPKIFLNPTTNSGGEMILPFFWHRDYVDVTGAQLDDLGEIVLRDLTGLKHANGADDVCNIAVFAWLEDVEFSGLTSQDADNLTAQSGIETEIDEANEKGAISGPATSIAAAGKALGSVPVIGPYAKATAKVASAIAGGAKLLGYSRPTATRDPEAFRPRPMSNLATTTVADGAIKLTVDDQQELTIDPGVSGIGREDPMDIKWIASHESWVTNFSWPEASGADTLLWNARVTPSIYHESVAGTKYLPACCAASTPFTHWTGSMKYRFQIVCSAYHKGRIKVVYDPDILGLNPEYNVNYVKVIDIAECSDFTITVPMTQDRTFIDTVDPAFTSVTELYSTSRYSTSVKEAYNGVIGVYVVNDLTTPNSTIDNSVKINVFVSVGDDFEVAVPSDRIGAYVFKPQSGIETDAINPTGMDAPEGQDGEEMGKDMLVSMDDIGHVYFGERIRSFRPLLKRYALHESFSFLQSSTPRIHVKRAFFPYYRGNVPNAVHTTAAAASYNYCNTLLMHWVVMMFSGFRGSIRYKLLPFAADPGNGYTVHVERDVSSYTADMWDQNQVTTETYATISEAAETTVYRTLKDSFPAFKRPPSFQNGGTYTLGRINPSAEFEIPFYSTDRFIPSKVLDWTARKPDLTSLVPVYRMLMTSTAGSDNPTTLLNLYAAAGEDFQVYFFTGMPPIHTETVPPNPAVT
jgi:hypothetical protein